MLEVWCLRLGLSLGFGFGVGIGDRIGDRLGSGGGIGRCRGRGNITPSLVPLHVPHTSDGLDLRCSGSPVIPVLEFSMLKHILAPSVAWIGVSHPPSGGGENVVCKIYENSSTIEACIISYTHSKNNLHLSVVHLHLTFH